MRAEGRCLEDHAGLGKPQRRQSFWTPHIFATRRIIMSVYTIVAAAEVSRVGEGGKFGLPVCVYAK